MIDRDNDLDPPFCRRGLLVGANGGAVDHLDVAVMRGSDGVHQSVPYGRLTPSHKADARPLALHRAQASAPAILEIMPGRRAEPRGCRKDVLDCRRQTNLALQKEQAIHI